MIDTFQSLAQLYVDEGITFEDYHERINALPESYVQAILEDDVWELVLDKPPKTTPSQLQLLADSLPIWIASARSVREFSGQMPTVISLSRLEVQSMTENIREE